jgi:hypothetical protein
MKTEMMELLKDQGVSFLEETDEIILSDFTFDFNGDRISRVRIANDKVVIRLVLSENDETDFWEEKEISIVDFASLVRINLRRNKLQDEVYKLESELNKLLGDAEKIASFENPEAVERENQAYGEYMSRKYQEEQVLEEYREFGCIHRRED